MRELRKGFEKRPLGQLLIDLKRFMERGEAFKTGYKLEAQKQAKRVPQPKQGDDWITLRGKHKGEQWRVLHVYEKLVQMMSLIDGQTVKTIEIKSLRKHYRPEGWTDES
jgi:hypothetical protein